VFLSVGDAVFDEERGRKEYLEFMNIEEAFAAQSPTEQDTDDKPPEEQPTSMQDINLDEYLDGAFDYQAPKHGDIRQGVVVEIGENGVVMDIGAKREGFVPVEDLSRLDEETHSTVQVGATIPVFVLRPADSEGRPVLSIQQAHMYKDWLDAEEIMKSGEIYEGEVSGYNRGGLIVKYGAIRGFIPASQVVGLPRRMREEQRRQRLASRVGEKMGLKIIEVDRRRRRLIFSQRRALRAWQEMQRARVIKDLVEGETRNGKVTSITDFGAFVDLGGADGLVHVSELSWRRVDHPREVLKVGDEVDVYVLSVDRQRKRIALSIKKLQPDPWTLVDDHYKTGQLVEGRVTRVLDFGAFVAVDLGIEGLLHAREMIGTPELNPSDIVKPGDVLPVKIVGIDSQRRRLDLSARQVRQDEWERWMAERQLAEEQAAAEAQAAAEEAAAEAADEAQAAAEEAATEAAGEAQLEADAEVPAEETETAVEEAVVEAVEVTEPEPEATEELAEPQPEAEAEAAEESTGETVAPEEEGAETSAQDEQVAEDSSLDEALQDEASQDDVSQAEVSPSEIADEDGGAPADDASPGEVADADGNASAGEAPEPLDEVAPEEPPSEDGGEVE
jgi:small subunit ribosomal protein S1